MNDLDQILVAANEGTLRVYDSIVESLDTLEKVCLMYVSYKPDSTPMRYQCIKQVSDHQINKNKIIGQPFNIDYLGELLEQGKISVLANRRASASKESFLLVEYKENVLKK